IARRNRCRSNSYKSLLSGWPVKPSITKSKVKIPAIKIDAPMWIARVMMSVVTIKFSPHGCLTNDSEREVSVCHVCINRNHTPHDLIYSCAELRERNVQQRVVGAIQMQIAFVHFFPGSVEDSNAANGGGRIFRKTNSNPAPRGLYCSAYSTVSFLGQKAGA